MIPIMVFSPNTLYDTYCTSLVNIITFTFNYQLISGPSAPNYIRSNILILNSHRFRSSTIHLLTSASLVTLNQIFRFEVHKN